jgi:hypothetical protein
MIQSVSIEASCLDSNKPEEDSPNQEVPKEVDQLQEKDRQENHVLAAAL